jgi:hypothetical protein
MKCEKCNKEIEPNHHICEEIDNKDEPQDEKKEKIILDFNDTLWDMLNHISDKKSK